MTLRPLSSIVLSAEPESAGAAPGSEATMRFPADTVNRLRESFAMVERQADIAALIFYRNLFTLSPELRALFNTSIELQGRKLMDSLRHTVATLEEPARLVPVLEGLGRRHVTYGTRDEHYAVVAQAMMQMLAEVLGKDFTAEVSAAWEDALRFVSEAMQRGAHDVQAYAQTQRR